MRTALRLRSLLGHPQYDGRGDADIFSESDPVYYARQGRDLIRGVNASRNSHRPSRSGRNSYRQRQKEGDLPRDEKKGSCLRPEGEFGILYKRLRDETGDLGPCEPSMPTGNKELIRIPFGEAKRMGPLGDRAMAWGAAKRAESRATSPSIQNGGPIYSKRWEKGGPNGYMGSEMYDSTPEIYHVTPRTQACLDVAINRALVGEAVELLAISLASDTQTMYLEEWKMWARFCDSRGISPCANTALRNWGRDVLSLLTCGRAVMQNGRGGVIQSAYPHSACAPE